MSDYVLYSYWRSSCSARLRIALNLKAISYDLVPVNLLKDEQLSDAHRELNPSASVPLLLCRGETEDTFKIGQSVAALEYLDEVHDNRPLLPPASDVKGRVTVRAMVNIVCCDTQPVTNLRIMRRVRELGGNAEEWNRELIVDGLKAYEAVCSACAGKYSHMDKVTMADVCLLPAVWNARRFGVGIEQFPTINRVVGNLEVLSPVEQASYLNQPDTPEEMRKKEI